MAFGLTETGFVRKDLATIKSELEAKLQEQLGNDINLLPQGVLGQLVGIYSERENSLWELLEQIYFSQFPDTAIDRTSLLNAVALTGIEALPPTVSTAIVRVFGTLGTVVPGGFQVSVAGAPDRAFTSIVSAVISSTVDEIQKIAFSAVPTAGNFSLTFQGQTTTSIPFNATSTTVQTALNALSNLSGVVVSGNFLTGFLVTFSGADGALDHPLIQLASNSLVNGVAAVSLVFTEEQKGYAPHVDLQFNATTTGPIVALAGSITNIVSATFGITSVLNLVDAIPGRGEETNAEIRLRRQQQLQRKGTASVEGIRAALLAVENVNEAQVIENFGSVADLAGRPPKSFEAFVEGGSIADIAMTIWKAKAGGIETFGSITTSITDSQGFPQTIKFSRPTQVQIWMTVNISKNTNATEGALYPANGDVLVRDAILAFASQLTIGNDVVTSRFFTPINTVPGVIGIQIFVGTAASPSSSANISIASTAVALFDSTRIVVNS